ncbi:MAG: 30S ribosomal protein S18 [Dehalococcoidia bacterium]
MEERSSAPDRERDGPPSRDGGSGERPQRPRGGGGRSFGRRKVCRFCVDHMRGVDYKDVGRLRVYISDRGKIEPRRKSGNCALHQRSVATAIKRARHLALLPYTLDHVRATGVFPTRG